MNAINQINAPNDHIGWQQTVFKDNLGPNKTSRSYNIYHKPI